MVILDEPTAALDPKAEAEVYERFHKMVEGRTSIYISHRMSSCRFCDEIIVFDKGQIVERGSHETLYAAGGSYARMQDQNQNQAGKALRIPAFFDKLYPSEEMDLSYARQAFRRDFHYFKFF